MENKTLEYTGKIQDALGNEIGVIFLDKNIDAISERAPTHIGTIKVDGVKYKVALWKFVPKTK